VQEQVPDMFSADKAFQHWFQLWADARKRVQGLKEGKEAFVSHAILCDDLIGSDKLGVDPRQHGAVQIIHIALD